MAVAAAVAAAAVAIATAALGSMVSSRKFIRGFSGTSVNADV